MSNVTKSSVNKPNCQQPLQRVIVGNYCFTLEYQRSCLKGNKL